MRYVPIEGYLYPYRINEEGTVESYGTGKWVPLSADMRGRKRAAVQLRRLDGTYARFGVAQLMAKAFMGGVPAGCGVFHKNGAKMDNALENLEIKPISAGGGAHRRRAVVKINRAGEIVEFYGTVTEAAKKNYMSRGAIGARCKNMVVDPYGADGHSFQYEDRLGAGRPRKEMRV